MKEASTTIVLGGGVGGVVAANALRKATGAEHRVILIDRQPVHLFAPSLLWLMTGSRSARQISRPLGRMLRKGVEVVCGEIDMIDPRTRRVRVVQEPPSGDGVREFDADYLVVSLGADLAPESIPGLADAGHSFYSLEGAESLRQAVRRFAGGRIVVLTAAPAYKCPAAPYEAAMLIEHEIRRRGLRHDTTIDLYAAEPGPLGVAGPEVSAGVRHLVESKGIGFHPEHQVVNVDPAAGRLSFANGAIAQFDLLAYVPPHRAPRVIRDAGLSDETGWIPTDRDTLHTRHPGVYAIGDVTHIPLIMGKPLPKAGVFAESQAKVVAGAIAAEINGTLNQTWFDGHGGCFIETGGGRAGFGAGDFYAEPAPQVRLRSVGRRWHLGKVLFEKKWLWRGI